MLRSLLSLCICEGERDCVFPGQPVKLNLFICFRNRGIHTALLSLLLAVSFKYWAGHRRTDKYVVQLKRNYCSVRQSAVLGQLHLPCPF